MVTTSIPPRPALVPGARIGRYELLHELEHDAIASTWISRERGAAASTRAARLSILEHRVSAELELKTRFLREARAAIRIKNPGFAQVLDSGPVGPGDTHLATVYFDAASLRELLTAVAARGVELSEGAILRIALDLAEPLSEMHSLRLEGPGALPLFHGDLRPEAIFVTLEGITRVVPTCLASAVCMLSARASVERLAYKAPEQLEHAGQRQAADAQADQFALGVVLYEAFTGGRPFDAADPLELVRTLVEAPAPSMGIARPDLPPAVAAIVDRLLKRDPRARFRSLEEARSALESAAQGIMADRAQVALAVRELAGDRITGRREAVRAQSVELSKALDRESAPPAARSLTPRPDSLADAGPQRAAPSGALPALRPPPLPEPETPPIDAEEPSTQRVPSVVPKRSRTPATALSPRLAGTASEPPRKASKPELRAPVSESPRSPRAQASDVPRPTSQAPRPSLRDFPRRVASESPRPEASAVPRPAMSDPSGPGAKAAEPARERDAPASNPRSSSAPTSSAPTSSEAPEPASRPTNDQPPSSERGARDSAPGEAFETPRPSSEALLLRAEDIVDSRASGSEFEPVPSEALQTVEERDSRRISTMPPARRSEPKTTGDAKTARRPEAKPRAAPAQPAARKPASRSPVVAVLVGLALGAVVSIIYIRARAPAPEPRDIAPAEEPGAPLVETVSPPVETVSPPVETAAIPELAAPTAAAPAETAVAPKPAPKAREPRVQAPAERRPTPAEQPKAAKQPEAKPAPAPKEKPLPPSKPAGKGKDDRMLDGI